jgi:hypothetical protein
MEDSNEPKAQIINLGAWLKAHDIYELKNYQQAHWVRKTLEDAEMAVKARELAEAYFAATPKQVNE